MNIKTHKFEINRRRRIEMSYINAERFSLESLHAVVLVCQRDYVVQWQEKKEKSAKECEGKLEQWQRERKQVYQHYITNHPSNSSLHCTISIKKSKVFFYEKNN